MTLEDAILQRVAVEDLHRWLEYDFVKSIEIFTVADRYRMSSHTLTKTSTSVAENVLRIWDRSEHKVYGLGATVETGTQLRGFGYFAVRTVSIPWAGAVFGDLTHAARRGCFSLYLGGSFHRSSLRDQHKTFDDLSEAWDYISRGAI